LRCFAHSREELARKRREYVPGKESGIDAGANLLGQSRFPVTWENNNFEPCRGRVSGEIRSALSVATIGHEKYRHLR
ncbi:MAG: hypothetical protein ACXWIP_21610, partial [Burkholderiales bacterium]